MKLQQLAHWSEIVASVAVVVTLLLLRAEVQVNTMAVERQVALDRGTALSEAFSENPDLARLLSRIRDVDGPDPLHAAFEDRYGFTTAEAVLWTRHLQMLWSGLEADYLYGQAEDAVGMVQGLIALPDNRLFVEHTRFSPAFTRFLTSLGAPTPPG